MSMRIASTATRKLRSTVMFVASFALALGSVSFAAPQFFSQIAHAESPSTIVISNITDLRAAVTGQADGQTWTINAGDYGLDRFNDISAGGETGWYLPIKASNLTIIGIGNPTLFGKEYSANGNWSSQNLVSVFGDNVTIKGLTFMPKADPNKTVEVIGNDFTLENTTITPNTKIADSVYDNIADPLDKAFAKQWGGSIYFSHAGNHLLKNVTVNNAGISFRYTPSDTHITFDNVNIVNRTSDDFTNGYRYSSAFNNSGNTVVGAPKVIYNVNSTLNNLDSALLKAQNSDTVNINSSLSTSKQINVTKALTINGNGNTVSPTFTKTDNSNNSVIGIQSSGVEVNNLVVDGTNGTNLHGINVYAANDVKINDVTSKNNANNGLVVNSSTVAVSNINTSGNGWGGIDVDQKASPSSSLTVNGQSTHSEAAADIYVDDTTKAVAVHDTNAQYGSHTSGIAGRSNDLVYKLKLAGPTSLAPTDNSYTNDYSFDNSWSAVLGAVKYEYETTYVKDGVTLTFADTSDSGNYVLGGAKVIRHNNEAPESTYNWKVRGVDAFGIKGAWSATSHVTVDKTTPATPTNGQPNATFKNTNDFYFNWSDSADAGSPITYEFQSSLNNAQTAGVLTTGLWNSLTYGITLSDPTIHSSGASDGTWFWQVRAIDAAGNKSAWSSIWNVTLDSMAATPVLISPSDNATLKGASVTQIWSTTDTDINHFVYESYNDAKATSLRWKESFSSTSKTATNVKDTAYWWRVKAVDYLGNESLWSSLWKVSIDNTAPVVIFANSDKTISTGSVTPKVDSGDATDYLWTAASSNPALLTFSAADKEPTFTPSVDGKYTFTLVAKDGVGNPSTPASFNFTYSAPVKPPVALPTVLVAPVAPIVGAAPYATTTPAAATTTPAGEVLGASTTKQDAPAVAGAQTSKDVAAEPAAKDGFNSAWYWLLTIPVAGSAWWALAAFRRRES